MKSETFVYEQSSLIDAFERSSATDATSNLEQKCIKPSDWTCDELCDWIGRNVKNSKWLTELFSDNEIEGSNLVK